MREILVDARGLSCPQPVLDTRQALSQAGAARVRVIVDNATASENVSRMAKSMGWEVKSEKRNEEEFHLVLTGGDGTPEKEMLPLSTELDREKTCCANPWVVVMINSCTLGSGDDKLGTVLMGSFLKTLPEVQPLPTAVIFMNSGVKLATEGSDFLESLNKLIDSGVQMLCCGTCLDFFHLQDKLKVGTVSNMVEIASLLMSADQIIRP